MNKKMTIFFLVLIVLLINSCNGNPFMTNLFSEIDKYILPSSFSSADEILDASSDDQFLDALTEDPGLADDVIDLLDSELQQDPENQEAALLLADVYLVGSGASDTIDGLNGLVSELASGNSEALGEMDSTDDVLSLIFSESQSQSNVESQLESFLLAAEAYTIYGDTIDSQGSSPELNSGEQVEVAFIAAISGITSYLVSNLAGDTPTPAEKSAAIAQIATSIVDGPGLILNDDPELVAAEDPMTVILGTGIASVVDTGFNNLDDLLSSFIGGN